MKITIDPFDKSSIASALSRVKQYKRDLKAKEKLFLTRLAEIGVEVANAGFTTAEYDGKRKVDVTVVKIPNGYAVKASGETVGFIEFGTGIRYPEWVDNNNESGHPYIPYPHGSYGKGQGMNPKGWYYGKGQHTYGNPPAEAMLTARNVMVEKVMQIAREVFQ